METKENRRIEMSEYNALRAEIISKQERKINVWLHMYILFIALFTLGVETNNNGLFLLTYLVIIPYQVMINNCEWNVARISAYIQTFYEANSPIMNWENFNTNCLEYTTFLREKTGGLSGFIRQGGSIHLGLLATSFFVCKTLTFGEVIQVTLKGMIGIVFSICLLIVTIHLNNGKIKKCDQELITIMQKFKVDYYANLEEKP